MLLYYIIIAWRTISAEIHNHIDFVIICHAQTDGKNAILFWHTLSARIH